MSSPMNVDTDPRVTSQPNEPVAVDKPQDTTAAGEPSSHDEKHKPEAAGNSGGNTKPQTADKPQTSA